MPKSSAESVAASADSAGVVAVVETQLSSFGLMPLRVARELGFRTAFLTNDTNRYRSVPIAEEIFSRYTDAFVEADTNSVEGVERGLEGLGGLGALRSVFTICDYNLPIVAEVAARHGLPTVAPQAAATARNKARMREVCSAAGIPCPRFTWAKSLEDAEAAAQEVGLPCVVKPMTESASVDVALCRTLDDVRAQYAYIAENPRDARGQPRPPGVLVEEYLVGYEVSVETVAVDGEIRVLGVTDKLLGPHPYFAEIGDTFPSGLPEESQREAAATAVAALHAIGHDFGAAHTEVKLTADGPRLVEVNARIAGDEVTELIRLSTGLSLLPEVLKMHTGEHVDLRPPEPKRAAASRTLATPAEGRVRALHGRELARRVPGVVDVSFKIKPGDLLYRATSNHGIVGGVLAVGAVPTEATRRAEAAFGQLSLELE